MIKIDMREKPTLGTRRHSAIDCDDDPSFFNCLSRYLSSRQLLRNALINRKMFAPSAANRVRDFVFTRSL